MRCAVANCKESNAGKASICSFFRFPPDGTIRKKWISFCGRKKFNPDTGYVCMYHFRPEDFKNNLQYEMGFAKKRLLNDDAVPSINIAHITNDDQRAQRIEQRENRKTVNSLIRNHNSGLMLSRQIGKKTTTELDSAQVVEKLNSGEFLLLDKNSESKVWMVFAKISKRDGEPIPNYIYCKCCKNALKFYNFQTYNLLKHSCYTDFYSKAKREISTAINEENGQIAAGENLGSDNNLTKLITRWILKECRQYELLHNEGLIAVFQELAKIGSQLAGDLNSAVLLPKPSDIADSISQIYKQCFDRVQTELSSIKEHGFSLTNTIQTDNLTRQSYITLIAHYIQNGVLKFNFLGFQSLEKTTISNQLILQKIEQILAEFDCKFSHRFLLVTDWSKNLDSNALFAQTVPCINQLLSSALAKSVENVPEVSDIIKNGSKLVNFLIKKGYGHNFDGFQNSTHDNEWLATYRMLNSVAKNWCKIEQVLKRLKEEEKITAIQVLHLKAVLDILRPFEEALETLEEDNSPTLHLVIMYLHELKKSCVVTADSEFQNFEFIEKLKDDLRNNLDKMEREDVTILHKIALFLYPPTKNLLQFNESERKLIEDECMSLMQNYKHEATSMVKLEPGLSAPDASISKRIKLLSDFIDSEADPIPNDQLLSQEIQFYKSIHVVKNADFNVFHWWQVQKDNFPLLYKLYCMVLAAPATCSLSKRIFSTARNFLRCRSAQLTKEADLEKLVFINCNSTHDELKKYFPICDST